MPFRYVEQKDESSESEKESEKEKNSEKSQTEEGAEQPSSIGGWLFNLVAGKSTPGDKSTKQPFTTTEGATGNEGPYQRFQDEIGDDEEMGSMNEFGDDQDQDSQA